MANAADYGNVREQVESCARWLGFQNEGLSDGLKSPEDAIKLWKHWIQHGDVLPEFADEEVDEYGIESSRKHRVKALGYDPLP